MFLKKSLSSEGFFAAGETAGEGAGVRVCASTVNPMPAQIVTRRISKRQNDLLLLSIGPPN
jgi:hypothetical protein